MKRTYDCDGLSGEKRVTNDAPERSFEDTSDAPGASTAAT